VSAIQSPQGSNRLISSLPRSTQAALLARCVPWPLTTGTLLGDSGPIHRHIYFPTAGFILLESPRDAQPPLALGMVGNEGMLGAGLALGRRARPPRAVVLGSGRAWRMTSARFLALMSGDTSLRGLMGRYLLLLMANQACDIRCARFHEIEPRLARWLLMVHDRVQSDHLSLIHQRVADSLGVQRSAITIAAGQLQRKGVIACGRGRIEILSRARLEAASCVCYAESIECYERQCNHSE
jgi:CRP-like cAMP-binding protein